MSMYNTNQPYMPGFGFRPQIFQQAGMPQQTPPLQQLPITFVSGMAPVEAAQAPFDGTPLLFYDTSIDAVHIKQFDANTGTAPVRTYRTEQKAAPVQFATVEMLAELSKRVDDVAAMMAPRKTTRKEADAE